MTDAIDEIADLLQGAFDAAATAKNAGLTAIIGVIQQKLAEVSEALDGCRAQEH